MQLFQQMYTKCLQCVLDSFDPHARIDDCFGAVLVDSTVDAADGADDVAPKRMQQSLQAQQKLQAEI